MIIPSAEEYVVRRAVLGIVSGVRIATTFKSNLTISIKTNYPKSALYFGLVVLLLGFCSVSLEAALTRQVRRRTRLSTSALLMSGAGECSAMGDTGVS